MRFIPILLTTNKNNLILIALNLQFSLVIVNLFIQIPQFWFQEPLKKKIE